MQEPSTATASCGGKKIYDECDNVDVDHLNSMSLEMETAIEKLLGEDPIPLDCANSASYDQLCRAVLKAADDAVQAKPNDATPAQLAALKANPQNFGVRVCLPGGGWRLVPADCFGGGDDGGGGGGTDPVCEVTLNQSSGNYSVVSGPVYVNKNQTDGSQIYNRWYVLNTGDSGNVETTLSNGNGSAAQPGATGPVLGTYSYSNTSGQGQTTEGTAIFYCPE